MTWSLVDALDLIHKLWPKLQPHYYIGLTGSVLREGQSPNDLDLIVYPASTQRGDKDFVARVLREAGLQRRVTVEYVHLRWRKKGSDDTKHVEVWEYGGKKVDIFFLS
jgi:hypothetical protein